MKLINLALLIMCILAGDEIAAQEKLRSISNEIEDKDDTAYKIVDFNLQVKNMHLWRGLHVTNSAVSTADINYNSKSGFFKAGLWGGRSFDGNYTEYDYYISLTHKNFTLAIWDINNTSDYPDVGFFNYDRAETSHFIDVSIAYAFQKIPLKLSWSTIVQGRDTYEDENGALKNAFTNYVEASYLFLNKKTWSLTGFVGGSFSFLNEAHFYGNNPGFSNVGIIYNKDVNIFNDYTLPISATASWNTVQEYSAIQIAVSFF